MDKVKQKQAGYGRGDSFPSNAFEGTVNTHACMQPIVHNGYQYCTRRVYFIKVINQVNEDENDRVLKLQEHGLCYGYFFGKKSIHARIEELRQATEKYRDAEKPKDFLSIDVAFSYSGLERLGVKNELLEVFRRKSPAFYDNAYVRAQHHIGDTGLSDPRNWIPHYQQGDEMKGFDVALLVHFSSSRTDIPVQNNALITRFETEMTAVLARRPPPPENTCEAKKMAANVCGGSIQLPNSNTPSTALLTGPWIETAMPLQDWKSVHFGYRDGITKPIYSASAAEHDEKGWRNVHALGEILLGYRNNDGENRYGNLGLTKKANSHLEPTNIPSEQKWNDFFTGSSFGVMRKIMQRTQAFENAIKNIAPTLFPQDSGLGVSMDASDPYALSKKWLKSKFLGRTPEGVMLTPSMCPRDIVGNLSLSRSNPNLGDEKGFHRTFDDDSRGLGCPFSSHIRRMNPRDDPVVPFVHRPLLRRGMPYTSEEVHRNEPDVGLSALFLCSDITEQFEHLAGKWANHAVMGIPDASRCKDPLIGNHERAKDLFHFGSQESDSPEYTVGFDQPFVITRGCAYVWFPTTDVLRNFEKYTAKVS